jgi:ribonuclease P protein component
VRGRALTSWGNGAFFRAPHSSAATSETGHEAYLPAPQCSSRAHARLPRPHGDARWSQSPPESSSEGARAPRRFDLQEVVTDRRAPLPTWLSAVRARCEQGGVRRLIHVNPHGFSRDRRLRKRPDFVRVQAASHRVSTRHYVLLVAAQPASAERPKPARARLGIVVTRKVGNAVARNRIKRVCRECFRMWPDLLPDGVDLVVIARQGADLLGLSDARAEWAGAARQLRRRAEEALAQGRSMPHVSARPTTDPPASGRTDSRTGAPPRGRTEPKPRE